MFNQSQEGNNRSLMPLDVLGRTRAILSCRIPSKRESSARVDYVPAFCTHRPSLLPMEWFSEVFGLALSQLH